MRNNPSQNQERHPDLDFTSLDFQNLGKIAQVPLVIEPDGHVVIAHANERLRTWAVPRVTLRWMQLGPAGDFWQVDLPLSRVALSRTFASYS